MSTIIGFVRTCGKEWLLTFSHKPSLFSSKKLERALLISVALILMCFFIYYNRVTLGPWEFLGLITPLFGYAGFNTVQGRMDKQAGAKTDLDDKKENNAADLDNKIEDKK